MAHTCHATGCKVPVPPKMWGCKRHWFMVPRPIRDRIWQTYRDGQCDDWNPSLQYLHAAKDAVIAVAEKEGVKPDTTVFDFFFKVPVLDQLGDFRGLE